MRSLNRRNFSKIFLPLKRQDLLLRKGLMVKQAMPWQSLAATWAYLGGNEGLRTGGAGLAEKKNHGTAKEE